ncbi:Hypothetical protein PBC10988_11520 [Planctomycetales bacterium 10988]|nr:Hypothetical protein PBC10988_11520 [Planctomycetales bacterium 10988]
MRQSLKLSLFLGAVSGAAFACLAQPVQAQGPDRQAAVFDRMDSNGDGVISPDEVDGNARRLFDRLVDNADSNKDGSLTKDEFMQALTQRPDRPEGERMRPDRPGERGPGDRGPGGPGGPGDRGRGGMERMFQAMDSNGDGKVTLDEVPEERRDRLEAMMERLDQNADGALSMDEFASMMQGPGGERGQRGERPDGPPRGDRERRDFERPGPPQGGPGGGMSMIAAFDHNRDGEITKQEIEETIARLKRMDRNNDDVIDRSEMPEMGMVGDFRRDGERGEMRRPGGPDGERGEMRRPGGGPEGFRGRGGPGGPGGPGGDFQAQMLERIFAGDTNGDKKLTREEAPERMRERFDEVDTNSDGFVDEAEVQQMFQNFRGPGGGQGGPGGRFRGRGDRERGPGDSDRPERPAFENPDSPL